MLSLFFPGMLLAVAFSVWFLVPLPKWNLPGALLMFFGLLTLVNAPFDWAAIGLTRALLRRGLSSGGRGPYFYALADACISALLVIVLAFATVLAVQTFDDIAVLRAGPGARILPLAPLFDGLAERPGDPEFWWVWLMLFSSQIPSFVNLVIAAAAFLRGSPFLTSWIVRRMPADKPVRENDRLLLAGALAGQIVGGPLITGALLYGLAVYVIPLGMPLLGTMIRDFSEQLAAYNAPAHVMMWLSKGH